MAGAQDEWNGRAGDRNRMEKPVTETGTGGTGRMANRQKMGGTDETVPG